MPRSFNYRSLNTQVPTASQRQLAALTARKSTPSRVKQPKAPVIRRIYQKTNESFKLAFVALRYGSLTDFSHEQ